MKQYFKSIRFRIWITFVVFALGTMVVLYFAQSVLTPAFYGYMKTSECISALNTVKSILSDENWDVNDPMKRAELSAELKKLAINHQLDIMLSFPDMTVSLSESKSGSDIMISRRITESMMENLLEKSDNIKIAEVNEDGFNGMVLATYVERDDSNSAYIFIYSYLEPIGTTMSIINTMFFISANVILVAACVVSIMISSHIANPLVKISRNANKLITGNFSMTVRKTEYEEIATLTENLNAASNEISKTETLRKDLLANVSHDLRTPLTMIKAYAEMIRDLSGNNPEKREKHLQVIIDEADRLTLLVNDCLNLSKLESGVLKMNMSVFDFSEHVEELASRFTMLDSARGYQLIHSVEKDIFIKADQQRIEQVFYNLVNNAINYIGEDKIVKVRLFRKDADTARFEVADSGVGIPAEQIPYIWDRYYKVDRSENHKRTVKGTGLGLSIVKEVLINHGFGFGCDSVVGQGSCFWFEFAIQKPEAEEKELLKP